MLVLSTASVAVPILELFRYMRFCVFEPLDAKIENEGYLRLKARDKTFYSIILVSHSCVPAKYDGQRRGAK